MKKRLFLILLAMLAVVFVFSACGKKGGDDTNTPTTDTPNSNTPAVCEHLWTNTSTTATCTTGGETTQTCSKCSATQKIPATALGHDMQKSQTVDPTCQTKGYDLYTCSRNCGAEPEKRNEFPTSITGLSQYHKYVEDANATAATCTEAGFSQMICEYCDATKDRKTLPALGHTFERTYGEDETDPTEVINVAPQCEVNGQITYKCADCDEVKVITYESLTGEGATEEDLALAETLKALEHEFTVENEKVDPTCLTAGYLIMECANGCKETKKVADYEPLGHTYTREGVTEFTYEEKLAPTCITPGKEWAKCDDCGYCAFDDEVPNVDYSRVVPATGAHVFDGAIGESLAPDCSNYGYKKYKCTADAECIALSEEKDIVPALGHNWVLDESKLINGEPTCLTNGNYPYYCDNYGADYGCLENATSVNEGGEVVTEIKHTYVPGEYASAPTCIKNAFYQCTTCTTVFEAYDDDEGAQATGIHIYNEESIEKIIDSTCSTYGYTIYKCSADDDCQKTECKDYTVRKPHTLSEVTSDGMTKCTECGEASFINTTTEIATEFKDENDKVIVSSEGVKLCDPRCNGEGCLVHNIRVFIVATTAPDEPEALELEGDVYKTTYTVTDKKVFLIELLGEFGQEYTITLKDANGDVVDSFDATVNGVNVKLNVKLESSEENELYDVDGTMRVDIAEVADKVATIEITSNAAASVNYYTNNAVDKD